MRLRILSALIVMLSTGPMFADDASVVLEFRPIAEMGQPVTETKGPAGEPAIEIVGGAAPTLTELVVCDNPAINAHNYVVRGRVKYEGVVGDGYLELWNDFGDKGYYFSRTLGNYGTEKKLNGTSEWRDFALPFFAEGLKPKRLLLNVVLPGAGKVTVTGPITVSPLGSFGPLGPWWTNQQGNWIAGIAGSLLGVLGALIGLSAAWGKSRILTICLCLAGIVIGANMLIVGGIAVLLKQPYHVYFPLLLLGSIAVIVLGINLRTISRRTQADEIRRMHAVDVV